MILIILFRQFFQNQTKPFYHYLHYPNCKHDFVLQWLKNKYHYRNNPNRAFYVILCDIYFCIWSLQNFHFYRYCCRDARPCVSTCITCITCVTYVTYVRNIHYLDYEKINTNFIFFIMAKIGFNSLMIIELITPLHLPYIVGHLKNF